MYNNPVNTIWGKNSFEIFLSEISTSLINADTLFLISPNGIANRFETLKQAAKDKGYWISTVQPNPDIEWIINSLKELDGFIPKRIVAVGGGSVLDAAKILKAFMQTTYDKNEIIKIINEKNYDIPPIELILIPTTAGTGSEKTKWATLWDRWANKKCSVEHEKLYANKAYVDPSFTYHTPVKQALIFGLDALTHAIEAFWSPNSINISRAYSIMAVEYFTTAFPKLLNTNDLNAREDMCLASLMSAFAFSHTRTTICHAISYALTLRHHVPHGLAAWLTLPYFLEKFSGNFDFEQRLFKAMNVRCANDFKLYVENVLKKAAIPYKLSEYGCKEKDLDILVKESFVPGRSDNTPVQVTADMVRESLQFCS